jgi:hypothetical protein
MADLSVDMAPRYLPDGYRLVEKSIDAAESGGFPGVTEQVTLVYTTSDGGREPHRSLQVYFTPVRGQELVATDQRRGQAVDIGGHPGRYHDGFATLAGRKTDGSALVRWTNIAHSVTVPTARGTFAVRAPHALPYGELLAVARSLPL